MINASIVNTIIGNMFFRDDEVVIDSDDADDDNVVDAAAKKAAKKLKEKTNATKLFILNEVDEDEDDLHSYIVTIKNIMRFNLAMDHVGSSMSFRQTASAIQHAKERTKTAKLAGIINLMVGQYVRVLVGSTLQQIVDCLNDEFVSAMSLAGDGSTHRGQSFFDLRVCICFCGRLLNLHLVAIPMFDRHTAGNIFNMMVKFLDALYDKWRAKLIGMSSDSENTMTGRHTNLVTRMIACAENLVLRIWCALHQIDLVVKSGAKELVGDEWIMFAWSFLIFMRAQANLITSMAVKCPKMTNCWTHLKRLLQFFKDHHHRIVAYAETHRPEHTPTSAWWVITFTVSPAINAINAINVTFVILQNWSLVIA